jgi:glutamate N-acetyltransferase/amino-acid N-acetyltransferase
VTTVTAPELPSWTGVTVPEGVRLQHDERGLAAIEGLRFAALPVGVRASSHRDADLPDVALLDVGRAVPAGVVLTTNQVRAAPCEIALRHAGRGGVRAVIINSGNANACTGREGMWHAVEVVDAVAAALGCASTEVVPMSTGVIGVPLPVERISDAAPALVAALAAGPEAAGQLATAIMTTDTRPKQVAVRVEDDRGASGAAGGGFAVAGVAKGAGMIEPAMATMLSVIVTDAELDLDGCAQLLRRVADRTFNRISVDSCGSTNDTVLLLATGTAGPVAADALEAAVVVIAGELARLVVTDGEGVTRIARLRISGAPDAAAASAWGRAIAGSALFRTALHGSDPNWGRILAAMGTTSVAFEPNAVDVRFGDVTVCAGGTAVAYDHDAAVALLRQDVVDIVVDMNLGAIEETFLVGDLSAGYVQVNAEYTT